MNFKLHFTININNIKQINIKVTVKDGSTLYVWVFQKGDKVYTIIIQGSEDMIKSLRPVLEQSWGLDPNTPGK